MGLSFSKILDVETGVETEDEHTRGLDENPPMLHDEAETQLTQTPYVKKTGKITMKESKNMQRKTRAY